MGFWIVMAMLACALAAVVVALAVERPESLTNERPRGHGAGRWLAVVADRPDHAGGEWAERLAALLPPTVDRDIVHAPGSTLTALRPSIREHIAARQPNVLVVWTALDDVLAGTGLDEYELALNDLLASLGPAGIVAVVGNVPDLARLPGAVTAGLPAQELRQLAGRWNAAIARLAHHHGALVADVSDLAPDRGAIVQPDSLDHNGALDMTTAAVVAERFLPVLRQALLDASHGLGDTAPDSL